MPMSMVTVYSPGVNVATGMLAVRLVPVRVAVSPVPSMMIVRVGMAKPLRYREVSFTIRLPLQSYLTFKAGIQSITIFVNPL